MEKTESKLVTMEKRTPGFRRRTTESGCFYAYSNSIVATGFSQDVLKAGINSGAGGQKKHIVLIKGLMRNTPAAYLTYS